MEPLNETGWSSKQLSHIYREWGLYFTKKHLLHIADDYYTKALDLQPHDENALYFRSQCKRDRAQPVEAMKDALKALERHPLRQPYNLEVCDGIYQCNKFEDNNVRLHQYSRKFQGAKMKSFVERLCVVDENLSDCLSNSLAQFALSHRKYILQAHEKMEKDMQIDSRPLWKILKEQEQCDVLSTLEIEQPKLTSMEVARRIRKFIVFNQLYSGHCWKDVVFLRSLQKDENLLIKQSLWSSEYMKALNNMKYKRVRTFLKMLQCRNPLYNKMDENFPDKYHFKRVKEAHLYTIQHQVHCDLLVILKKMYQLQQDEKITQLRKYIETIMGDYVALKTLRIMPHKYLFTNEVYNILALALVKELLQVPDSVKRIQLQERLRVFFKMPPDTVIHLQEVFVFGERTQSAAFDEHVKRHDRYQVLEERLRKRLFDSKYSIEKAYIYHELAYINLLQYNTHNCFLLAQKSVTAAKKVRSYIWTFLGLIMMCKCHSIHRKWSKIIRTLNVARIVCNKLKSKALRRYLLKAARIARLALVDKRALDRTRSHISRMFSLSSS